MSWIVQEKAAPLLAHQPFIDKLFILPNNFLLPKQWGQMFKQIKRLRQINWDVIIDFQGLWKTSLLHIWLHGKKFGFDKNNSRAKTSSWCTAHHTSPIYTNIVQKNLALASDVVSHVANQILCPAIHDLQKEFVFFVPYEQKQKVENWLEQKAIRSVIILAPNTTWESKHWPLGHWKQLLEVLHAHHVPSVLLGEHFGTMGKALTEYVREKKLNVHIAPKWDLSHAAYLIMQSRLLVAPDTGLLHLADFLGTKTIGIFGPTLAQKHGPFFVNKSIEAAIQIPCPHIYQKSHSNTDCMKQLTPQQLMQTISRFLDK